MKNKSNYKLITASLVIGVLTACSSSDTSSVSSSSVTITTAGTIRTIISNGIPDHGLDENASYANDLVEDTHSYSMTTQPQKNTSLTVYTEPQKFGIALNGIPFDPFSAEYYQNDSNSGWHIDATGGNLGLDTYGAHIQPDGTYHYHSVKTEFFDAFTVVEGTHSPLIGYAADGFPIYAKYAYETATNSDSYIIEIKSNYKLKPGLRPNGPGGIYDGTYIEDYEYVDNLNSDLNEANARYGVTPAYPNGTWYYVLTSDFPYIPIQFLGNTHSSFSGGPNNNINARHHHPHY
jgi:hypothetical protein